ncbi:MAG: hypothetical protein J6R77_02770 [Clostridia bacterium]|nr:hypothetical protein [Clostridia bacterium]
MKNKWLFFALGALSAVVVMLAINFFTEYKGDVRSTSGTGITYKSVEVSANLSADVRDYLGDGSGSRRLYFGDLPDKKEAIRITSHMCATFYVYPLDEESMLVKYEPYNGIHRTYKLTWKDNFNKLLKSLYETTGNEVFAEEITY